ncbi:hypothetical protein PR048_017817 [Dryococelus australis]|uniref:Uncharacterized protein n=1 Tax=Dryococelus australis TaxID=614101 RepID=A0ABQ9HAP6_9NEOP|nr:hypothetical protein PR048_017817 [Dryococelus australis]
MTDHEQLRAQIPDPDVPNFPKSYYSLNNTVIKPTSKLQSVGAPLTLGAGGSEFESHEGSEPLMPVTAEEIRRLLKSLETDEQTMAKSVETLQQWMSQQQHLPRVSGWSEASKEERRNAMEGETGDTRIKPADIVRLDSHLRKSRSDPAGNRTRFSWSGYYRLHKLRMSESRPPRIHTIKQLSHFWLHNAYIRNSASLLGQRGRSGWVLASHHGDPVRYPVGSLLDFRIWESCWTMPLADGFSRGTPVSPTLSFQRRSTLGSHFMSCPGMIASPWVHYPLEPERKPEECADIYKGMMSPRQSYRDTCHLLSLKELNVVGYRFKNVLVIVPTSFGVTRGAANLLDRDSEIIQVEAGQRAESSEFGRLYGLKSYHYDGNTARIARRNDEALCDSSCGSCGGRSCASGIWVAQLKMASRVCWRQPNDQGRETGGNPEVLKHAKLANHLTAGFCGLSTVDACRMEWNSLGT